MKNFLTSTAIALCLGTFSFTCLKDPAMVNNEAMVHTVYFWLQEDISEEDKLAFEEAIQKLGTVPTIKHYYWGPPAPTEARGVVDNSYDYALNVFFEKLEDHDVYQTHPIHLDFIEKNQDKWTTVKVYDNNIK